MLMVLSGAVMSGAGVRRTAASEQQSQGSEQAQWTVMLYMCGSNLESHNSIGTHNLTEIYQAALPVDLSSNSEGTAVGYSSLNENQVNMLIETGGSSEWHAQELQMDISTESLQRWRYDPLFPVKGIAPFENVDEAPLASMADPETLTDFIRWSVQNYPAEKYALILWDHGGGSKTGLFLDELYGNDVLYLDELSRSLTDAGTHFEIIAIDACMMGNLETAAILKDHANYMVASEELASGNGTAYAEWLKELYNDPGCDGLQFGRVFCDTVMHKYANLGDDQSSNMLTYSLMDLSKIEHVMACFDQFFHMMGIKAQEDPENFAALSECILNAAQFGRHGDWMVDLADIFYRQPAVGETEYGLRNEMINALADAVVYCVKGSGRARAYGISFCYAGSFTADELNTYARNCFSGPYLAYLDMLSDWSAPDWVYEQNEHLNVTEDKLGTYELIYESYTENGLPVLKVMEENSWNYGSTGEYELYQEDASGELVRLCRDSCTVTYSGVEEEPSYEILSIGDITAQPTIDGALIDMELVSSEIENTALYNVPVQINETNYDLRLGLTRKLSEESWHELVKTVWNVELQEGQDILMREGDREWYEKYITSFIDAPVYTKEYEVYGLWEGYDAQSQLPGRNVMSLSTMQGREYVMLYPHYAEQEERTYYSYSQPLTMYRSLEIEEKPLDPGTYYVRYILTDIFGRKRFLPMTKISWDGAVFTTLE